MGVFFRIKGVDNMNKKETIRNVVENVLICEDEKFKEFLAPHINEALEEHTTDWYLSWGYGDDTPLERLKEYWGDIVGEEDPDVEIDRVNCKSVRECRKEDCAKIKKFIDSQNIEDFVMFQDKSWIWLYKPTGQHIEAYIKENVDTILNTNMLTEEIAHILVEKRFEYVIQNISNVELVNVINSKWKEYDHEAHMLIDVKIIIHERVYSIYSTCWEIIMNEVKRRLIEGE